MGTTRRSQGFQPAGSVRAGSLDLPRKRARELELARAWRSVAGAVLAAKAPAISLVRGTLLLAVEDPRWAEPIRGSVRVLAGRLAHRYPELGVRRLRLRVGEAGPGETLPVEPSTDAEPLTAELAQVPRDAGDSDPEVPGDLDERLESLANRYLRSQKP